MIFIHNFVKRGVASVINISILNPLVKIECDQSALETKDEQFFKKFTVVCLTNTFDIDTLVKLPINLFTFGCQGKSGPIVQKELYSPFHW
jgi:hypothetical protein